MEMLLLPQIHAALVGTEGGAIKVGVVVEDALGGRFIKACGELRLCTLVRKAADDEEFFSQHLAAVAVDLAV